MAEPKKLYMGPTSTQELINLLKADLAKKQDIIQFTVLPNPEDAVGRCYEYVGPTTMYFTNGHLYHSTGFEWEEIYKGLDGKSWQIVDALPSYADASFDLIYFVWEDGSIAGYIKGDEQMEKITSDHTWELTTSLPAWDTAKDDTIYFIPKDGRLSGFVKDVSEEDSWYELGGKANFNELDNIPTVNGISLKNEAEPDEPKEVVITTPVHRHMDDDAYDVDAPIEDEDVPVHEVELTAISNEQIDEIWERA